MALQRFEAILSPSKSAVDKILPMGMPVCC
jgi:hypothetical protein